MNRYEIWGQEDEDNLAHNENYTVNEALGAEANSPQDALEKLFTDVYTASQAGVELMAPPANESHYHFKVIDADTREEKEFVVTYMLIPMVRIGELGPAPTEGEASIPTPESI